MFSCHAFNSELLLRDYPLLTIDTTSYLEYVIVFCCTCHTHVQLRPTLKLQVLQAVYKYFTDAYKNTKVWYPVLAGTSLSG